MAKKIVITSGKGGVGKTTIVANLGSFLADMGQRVALIDVDFGLNNLDVVLGVEDKIIYDISDVFEGRCRLKQALVQCFDKKSLFVLPSGNVSPSSNINGQNLKLLIDGIDLLFDYVLIDCPAGLDVGFHRAVSCADDAIVVVTPNVPSIRDADKIISVLQSYKLNSVSLVINRVRGDLILDDKMMMPKDIKEILSTNILGILPEEDQVFLSCGTKIPKRTNSYKAFKILANNLINGENKIFDVFSKYEGFLGSIRRSLKKSIWEKVEIKLLECNTL